MSLPPKTLTAIQNAALEDPEVAQRILSLVRRALPGQAKFAVLNQEQRKYLWNRIKAHVLHLSAAALQYYKGLADGQELVLQEKSALLRSLGATEDEMTEFHQAACPLPAPSKKASAKQYVSQGRQAEVTGSATHTVCRQRPGFGRRKMIAKNLASCLELLLVIESSEI